MRSFRHTRSEEGQSLIFIALALLGLMAFLGLAVDGGNIYLQRRNVQNAADGAALAGAVVMAQNRNIGVTEAALCGAVQDYAVSRHLSDLNLLEIYYTPTSKRVTCSVLPVPPPPAVNGIRVVTGRNFSSLISQVIGQNEFTVRATATAQFGPAKAALGTQPIAVHKSVVPPASQRNNPLNEFHIWTDDKGTPGVGDITGAGRGWIDLDCNYPAKCNHSEDDIKEWMKNTYQQPIATKYELQSAPGVKAASLKDPYVSEGKTLILPVYDYVRSFTSDPLCDSRPENHQENGGEYDPGWQWDQCHDNPAYGDVYVDTYTDDPRMVGSYYYHIISFAAFYVTGTTTQGSNKSIDGYFVDYIAEGDLGGPYDTGVTVIKMTQ
ncbi:MAG: Tad domain-containing protein [Ardenticatenaceae bacterium]|nr:Tad domain-containing protein [Ardenticatenaceae bacterium]HBY95174.1 hypothetical protein [Chloroflexota bacterium]